MDFNRICLQRMHRSPDVEYTSREPFPLLKISLSIPLHLRQGVVFQ